MSLYGPTFHTLLSIYVLYSNVTYIYPVTCLVEIKLFQLFQNCFKLFQHVTPAQAAPIHSIQVALRGYCPVEGRGTGQPIGSTVFDANVHCWLWLTAARCCPLG